MEPLLNKKLDGGGVGKGKGCFQFEGARGVPKKGMVGKTLLILAINRASRYYTNKGMQIPLVG